MANAAKKIMHHHLPIKKRRFCAIIPHGSVLYIEFKSMNSIPLRESDTSTFYHLSPSSQSAGDSFGFPRKNETYSSNQKKKEGYI